MSSSPRAPNGTLGRELLMGWLHLAVLWAFAIVKPLLDVLADEAAFFVARGNTRADILILTFGLMFAPPTLLVAIEALLFRFRRVRHTLHVAFVGGLIALFALQVLVDAARWDGRLLLACAAGAGVAGAFLYARSQGARSVLTALGPAPLVFLVLFLLFSPVSKLVIPQDEEGAEVAKVTGRTPLVMVVFDELSGVSLLNDQRHVDAKRFPGFDRLAQESTWYRNATTVADVTTQAMPALLTGKRADRDKLPTASEFPDNLFGLLGPSYKLDVHESATRLCPERFCGERVESSTLRRLSSLVEDLSIVSLHQLLPEELDDRLPAVDQTFANFRGGGDAGGTPAGSAGIPNQAFVNRKHTFEEFTANLRSERGRWFHFFHAQLPHIPFQYLPSRQEYPQNGPSLPGLDESTWEKDASLVRQAEQRYLLQAGFVDALLGKLVKQLKEAGMWDRAVVVVTADHGVSFYPGLTRRYVNGFNFADVASVPLFIKAPGQRAGRIDDSAVTSVDVVPTVARYLDLDLPRAVDGSPLQEERERFDDMLTVTAFAGGEVQLPFDDFIRRRDESARLLNARLDGTDNLYELGPRSDLVGQRTRAFRLGPALRAKVEFDAPGLYASVDPGAPVVPALITGRITGDPVKSGVVAIAINGEIQATAEVFPLDGDTRFSAVVAPGAFRAGRNSVRLLSVTGEQASTGLAAIETGRETRLAERGGSEVVVLPSGGKAEIDTGAVTGSVDRITFTENLLTVHGWAVDAQSKVAADRVLIFSGDRLLVAGAPSLIRGDIADLYGDRAEKSGYQLRTVVENAEELADPEKLRVIGLSGSRASQLELSGGAYVGAGP
jgi:hypothetical protein